MENKKEQKPKLTIKNINRAFGIVMFLLVFIFTLCWIDLAIREHWIILVSVFSGLIGLAAIIWIIMVLVIRYKTKKSDINQQKIQQALDNLQKEQESNKIDGVN